MPLLVVQMGHVGRTSGATGTAGEQAFTAECGKRIVARVKPLGHSVRLIAADEPDNAYKGDLFVAVHGDGSPDVQAHGASVGYRTPEGQTFAHAWIRHYKRNGWTGGFRADNYTANLSGYYGVKRAVNVGNRRAFILEAGFLTNRPDADPNVEDAQLLASPAGPDRVAIAVAGAVIDMVGTRCPPSPPLPGIPMYPGIVSFGDGMPPENPDPNVGVWQNQLKKRGYPITIDGRFGERTLHVVIDWQAKHHLEVDGICGPATWHSLLFDRT